MGSNHIEAQLHQNGGAGSGHDAVVGGGGNAHAQHDAAQHGQHQTDDGGVACQIDDTVDEDGSKTGNGDAAGDDTSHGAGHSHGDGAAGTGLESLKDLAGGQTLLRVEEAHHDSGEDGHGGGELHGTGTGGHQCDQQHQRQQQIDLLQQIADLGQLALGDALQTQLLGLQMDGNEDTGEIENSRQDGLDGNLHIGQIHVLCHQEGGSAHDGRHDLTTGGGSSLNSGGKLGLIARLFHQRDGDRAGAHGVGNGRTGAHTLQGAGNHRHLGRAAGIGAHQTVGELNEVVTDTGALKEGTEDDKQNNIRVADVDGGADNTGGGVEQLIDDVLQRLIEVGVIRELIDKGIDHQRAHHAEDGDTHAAAAQFDQHQNADDTDDHMDGLDTGSQLDDGQGIKGKVEEAACAQHHQHDVIPGNVVDTDVALLHRVGDEAHHDDEAEEQGQTRLGQSRGEQRHVNAVQRENREDHAHNDLGHALPYTGSGFAVIFPHHRIKVQIVVVLYDRICLVFFEQAHGVIS